MLVLVLVLVLVLWGRGRRGRCCRWRRRRALLCHHRLYRWFRYRSMCPLRHCILLQHCCIPIPTRKLLCNNHIFTLILTLRTLHTPSLHFPDIFLLHNIIRLPRPILLLPLLPPHPLPLLPQRLLLLLRLVIVEIVKRAFIIIPILIPLQLLHNITPSMT